jgi:hypothetical protein
METQGPTKQLKHAVARIRSKDSAEDSGKVVGMGVFVSENHVLTCAHVVCKALDWNIDTAPDEPVSVDLPLLQQSPCVSATVVSKRWKSGGLDVALLSVDDSPTDVQVPDWYSNAFYKHPFSAYGCPPDREEGVWTNGKIGERRETNVQLQLTQEGYPITKGFSGGPVWDQKERAVVGIVEAYERQRETDIAFMLPHDVIKDAFPNQSKVSAPSDIDKELTELTDAELTGQLIKSDSLPPSVRSLEPLKGHDPSVVKVKTSKGYPAVGLVRARPATDKDIQFLESLRDEIENDGPIPLTWILLAPKCKEKARLTLERSEIQFFPINPENKSNLWGPTRGYPKLIVYFFYNILCLASVIFVYFIIFV